ncbi:uncharacterized protein [Leptinotarsa decemlineata]|uniref:uncharacterized protein n=1 Tax=Leptinotarsa decemlineata TaxID=7539 RepID=UPI003D30BF70
MPPIKRTRVDAKKIEEAVNEVLKNRISVRSTAKVYNVSKSHLHRLVTKAKTYECTSFVYIPNIGNKRVFTTDQESSLADYLNTSAKMCHGLTMKQGFFWRVPTQPAEKSFRLQNLLYIYNKFDRLQYPNHLRQPNPKYWY